MPEESMLERVCNMQFNKLATILNNLGKSECKKEIKKLKGEYRHHFNILTHYKDLIENHLLRHYFIKYEYYKDLLSIM